MTRIAIHGFGRIGRSTLRAALLDGRFTSAALSDVQDPAMLAALFAVDSNYGRWPEPVSVGEGGLQIGKRAILYYHAGDGLPDWGGLGIGLVIDCTGRATTRTGAQAHLDRGAGRVLISAASRSLQDADAVLLPGINLDQSDPERHRIISMGSCTTNALAPVVKVVRERWGIRQGLFTTVHAYTNTQSLTDQPLSDRRDSWAAAESIISSSSGAAKALKFIWPDLNVTSKAYRVPVRTGSIVELTAVLERAASRDEVNTALRAAAAEGPLRGVMSVLKEEWPSARIVGDPHSSLIDLPLTQVLDGRLLRHVSACCSTRRPSAPAPQPCPSRSYGYSRRPTGVSKHSVSQGRIHWAPPGTGGSSSARPSLKKLATNHPLRQATPWASCKPISRR